MEPSGARPARTAGRRHPAADVDTNDADLVRLLHDALGRLGIAVRVEPMPEEARLAGGYCVVRGKPELFLAPTASLAAQRETLIEALRAVGTEHVWLPPALRALVEGP
jgi:hypothetical protein